MYFILCILFLINTNYSLNSMTTAIFNLSIQMAYMSTRLLDDNQAYIISSERVHVDYRGRGFMKQLGVYANEYIKAYLSGPRVLRKFSYYSSEEILKKLQRHPERKIIHTTVRT